MSKELKGYEALVSNRSSSLYKPMTEYEQRVVSVSHALSGEIGEVQNKITKTILDSSLIDPLKCDHTRMEEVRLELGDSLYYFVQLVNLLGWTLSDIIQGNVLKLRERDGGVNEAQPSEGTTGPTA